MTSGEPPAPLLTETPPSEQDMRLSVRGSERRWVWAVAVGAMALTMVPFLWGYSLQGLTPARGWFSWLGYNLDDACVYLSWMRQAADGHFFQRNLFTTEPQSGHQFNLFFLALGNIARITHLPLLAVFHLSRLLLGVALLRAIWWLIEMWIEPARARKTAFLLVCFSAGVGWMPGFWRESGINSPVDVWQPESVTFLCLYTNPLFLIGLLLMVGVIGWLWVGEQTRRIRPAVYAGLCGLLLGNIHTYDVITLTAVWGAFLVVRTVLHRRFDTGAWQRALIAGALTAVSTGYTYYLLRTEEVFAKRVAVPTLSPPCTLYLLGFGLLLPLAVAGAAYLFSHKDAQTSPSSDAYLPHRLPAGRLMVIWFIMNLAVAYLPVPFQRKMLMGVHLPLAMLGGVGLWWLLHRLTPSRPAERETTGTSAGKASILLYSAALLLLFLTNGRFLLRDMRNFQVNIAQSQIHRPYMFAGEVAALQWLRDHLPPHTPVQPLPWIVQDSEGKVRFYDTTVACFTPGLTGLPVNAGHWGETPDFGETMGKWVRFLLPHTSDEWRQSLLRATGVRYLLFSQKREETGDSLLLSLLRRSPPPYLRRVPSASNADADVYEVMLRQP